MTAPGQSAARAEDAILYLGPPGDRHRFALQGRYFWVDAPSGAVHELSPLAMAVLGEAEAMATPPAWTVPAAALIGRLERRQPRGELTQAIAELLELADAGLLFTSRPAGAGPVPFPAPAGAAGTAALRLQTLSLHVAHSCNLRCQYCFAGDGSYERPKQLMTAETARRAVDYLLAHRAPAAPLTVEFFGGEPLLNLPVVAETAAYAREQADRLGVSLHLTVSTNGTRLGPEELPVLERYRIETVISLDGRPSVHDAMRPGTGGTPSYAGVRAGLERLMAATDRPRCFVRAVFTSRNTDFAADALHLLDLPSDGVAMEPAVGCGHPWSLGDAEAAAVEAEYERLAVALAGRAPDQPGSAFLPFLLPSSPPSAWDSGRGCGAGVFELAVAPDGGLYPCHRFVGYPDFEVGTLVTGITRPEIATAFTTATAATKQRCRTCWARSWCGGGCQANGYEVNGSILDPDAAECRLRKKRLECAFWLQAERQEAGAPVSGG